MTIQHWQERVDRARLPPQDHEVRAVLLRRKAYRFPPHELQLDNRRTIDLYARFNWVTG